MCHIQIAVVVRTGLLIVGYLFNLLAMPYNGGRKFKRSLLQSYYLRLGGRLVLGGALVGLRLTGAVAVLTFVAH